MTRTVNLKTIEVSDIDTKDAPDFVDAYISYAEWDDGIELNDHELDLLNEDDYFVYRCVLDSLY
jgi:hypothetical protein